MSISKNNVPLDYFKIPFASMIHWCIPRSTRCRQECECPQCPFFLEALEEQGEFDKVEISTVEKPRNRGYLRHMDYTHTRRKVRIAEWTGWEFTHNGSLRKGKVHCSCGLCKAMRHYGTRKSKLYKEKHKERY